MDALAELLPDTPDSDVQELTTGQWQGRESTSGSALPGSQGADTGQQVQQIVEGLNDDIDELNTDDYNTSGGGFDGELAGLDAGSAELGAGPTGDGAVPGAAALAVELVDGALDGVEGDAMKIDTGVDALPIGEAGEEGGASLPETQFGDDFLEGKATDASEEKGEQEDDDDMMGLADEIEMLVAGGDDPEAGTGQEHLEPDEDATQMQALQDLPEIPGVPEEGVTVPGDAGQAVEGELGENSTASLDGEVVADPPAASGQQPVTEGQDQGSQEPLEGEPKDQVLEAETEPSPEIEPSAGDGPSSAAMAPLSSTEAPDAGSTGEPVAGEGVASLDAATSAGDDSGQDTSAAGDAGEEAEAKKAPADQPVQVEPIIVPDEEAKDAPGEHASEDAPAAPSSSAPAGEAHEVLDPLVEETEEAASAEPAPAGDAQASSDASPGEAVTTIEPSPSAPDTTEAGVAGSPPQAEDGVAPAADPTDPSTKEGEAPEDVEGEGQGADKEASPQEAGAAVPDGGQTQADVGDEISAEAEVQPTETGDQGGSGPPSETAQDGASAPASEGAGAQADSQHEDSEAQAEDLAAGSPPAAAAAAGGAGGAVATEVQDDGQEAAEKLEEVQAQDGPETQEQELQEDRPLQPQQATALLQAASPADADVKLLEGSAALGPNAGAEESGASPLAAEEEGVPKDGPTPEAEKGLLGEGSASGLVLEVELRHPLLLRPKHPNSTSSAMSWCEASNLLACCSQASSFNPRASPSGPPFVLPVSVMDPDNPLEHAVLRVPTSAPGVSAQGLLWSPLGTDRLLVVLDSSCHVSIWSHPRKGELAESANSWAVESHWQYPYMGPTLADSRTGGVASLRFLQPPHPTTWPPLVGPTAETKSSLEARFAPRSTSFVGFPPPSGAALQPPSVLPPGGVTAAPTVLQGGQRWPRGFLCLGAVLASGHVCIHWRQWPRLTAPTAPAVAGGAAKRDVMWSSSLPVMLPGCQKGVIAADVCVVAGEVVVAAVPRVSPGKVLVYRIGTEPEGVVGSAVPKTGGEVQCYAPVPGALLQWTQQSHVARVPGAKGTGVGQAGAAAGSQKAETKAGQGERTKLAKEGPLPKLFATKVSELVLPTRNKASTVQPAGSIAEAPASAGESEEVITALMLGSGEESLDLSLTLVRAAEGVLPSLGSSPVEANGPLGASGPSGDDEKADAPVATVDIVVERWCIAAAAKAQAQSQASASGLLSQPWTILSDALKSGQATSVWERAVAFPAPSVVVGSSGSGENVPDSTDSPSTGRGRKRTRLEVEGGSGVDKRGATAKSILASLHTPLVLSSCSSVLAVALPSPKSPLSSSVTLLSFPFLRLLHTYHYAVPTSPAATPLSPVHNASDRGLHRRVGGPTRAALCLSPNSLCVAYLIKGGVVRMSLVPNSDRLLREPWHRHLADRMEHALVTGHTWWDVVACTSATSDLSPGAPSAVLALVDADYHALESHDLRHYYMTVLDQIKSRLLEDVDGPDVRAVCLDLQARVLTELVASSIESVLVNPGTFIRTPWIAVAETYSQLGHDAMSVDPSLVPTVHAYVDTALDLVSHFLTRLRRYFSFYRTMSAAHAHQMAAAAKQAASASSAKGHEPASSSQAPGTSASTATAGTAGAAGTATASAAGTATASAAGSASSGANPSSSSPAAPPPATSSASATSASTPAPTAATSFQTVPSSAITGLPAVRLLADPTFLRRLCQLMFFCLIFRKRSPPAPPPKTMAVGGKEPVRTVSEVSGSTQRSGSGRGEDRYLRLGNGNGGLGYTPDEVKVLFRVCSDLCSRTSMLTPALPPPPPPSIHPPSGGSASSPAALHYPEGFISVSPESIEAWVSPHMQSLPRPRGADAAGLLMRELELQPPSGSCPSLASLTAPSMGPQGGWGVAAKDVGPAGGHTLGWESSVTAPWDTLESHVSGDVDSLGMWKRPRDKRRLTYTSSDDEGEGDESEDSALLEELLGHGFGEEAASGMLRGRGYGGGVEAGEQGEEEVDEEEEGEEEEREWAQPRKRWRQERDAALGLATTAGLASVLGFFGGRRDAVLCQWQWGPDATWFKCLRCRRHTCCLNRESPGEPPKEDDKDKRTDKDAPKDPKKEPAGGGGPGQAKAEPAVQSKEKRGAEKESGERHQGVVPGSWASRWNRCCPMCGGLWATVL